MIEDFSFNIKFTGQFNDCIDNFYGHTGGFVNLPDCGFFYGSLAQVKAKSKEKAKKFIDRAVRNAENRQKLLIATGDGHVLVIAYDDGWGYSIASDGRQHNHAGGSFGGNSFKEVCEKARSHAEECFGGVAWENRL